MILYTCNCKSEEVVSKNLFMLSISCEDIIDDFDVYKRGNKFK